jgi:alkylation response protein AidB-like acyl-CoA dehydrogenase
MTPFTPPIAEQRFLLDHVAGLPALAASDVYAAATPDLVDAVLEGAGAFAAAEFAPLNQAGDRIGAKWTPEGVTMPRGFAEAYRAYVDGGWGTILGPEEHGGQGMPFALATAVLEDLGTANMAFSLIMMLTPGAVEALMAHGSPEQQARWLPKLVSGEWNGTMCLTEAQAGSDVGALRTRAVRQPDGSYRIKGQKIFITFGEHDLTDNIVHLVLARTPDAPAGTRGISLFLVPRFRLDAEGRPGAPNDVRAVSIEHKMGIHASPTCVMAFGDEDECIGELVGAENGGMRAMFTMMNNARLNVGLQGVSIAERARQQAVGYARDRVQSARAGAATRDAVAIAQHPDVRRMLLRMAALTQGARAVV